MQISLNLGGWNAVFAVPSCVVDKHIKLAGAAQLKVLLWVLRHAGEPLESDDIAKALSMHPADVNDAMQYWLETGLLSSEAGALSPAAPKQTIAEKPLSPAPPKETPTVPSSQPAPDKMPEPRLLSRPQKPDSVFVAKRINESSDISFLMQEAQVILGRPISNGDCATLLMLHDNDGLPIDVIIMLLQYTVSIGKSGMKYIEKTGIGWAGEGIDSLQKAEQKIKRLSDQKNAWNLIVRTLGLEPHSPTKKESEAADRWLNEWGFTVDLIREAYERCVDAKGRYIPSYTNTILERWHREGVKTLDQAMNELLKNKAKRNGNGNNAASYDIEEYERNSIFDDLEK